LGPEYSERISPHVQTAAVFGLGLVHQSSCQRLMVELSLNEIGRRPSERSGIASSYPDARNSYALAAGFSLGLLCLGKGGSEKAFGLRDLNVEARLLNYIWGDFEASAKSRPQNDDDSSSCVLEVIDNPSVTAVPALIALGLMYMKTNNKSVADQIGIPENPFLLERIRIDQLLMLALVRHLILWDEISPSKLWVQQKIPEYLNLKRTGESSSQTEFICAKLYIAAGCSIAVGLKYAGTYDKEAYDFLYDETYLLWKDLKRCSESSKSVSLAMKTSLAVTAIALSMVVAGSGNLDAFKLFRAIRKSALFFNEVIIC
jgi:anaphase-promoting complex subunit 1